MTNDEIRIKIAELKGWSYLTPVVGTFKKDTIAISGKGPDGYRHINIPSWPTDPAAALGLVEEMRPHFFSVMIMGWDHTSEWCVECTPRHGHDEAVQRPFGKATSLPLAVCLAYIAWKEQGK